jgi:hypothetical protein
MTILKLKLDARFCALELSVSAGEPVRIHADLDESRGP